MLKRVFVIEFSIEICLYFFIVSKSRFGFLSETLQITKTDILYLSQRLKTSTLFVLPINLL